MSRRRVEGSPLSSAAELHFCDVFAGREVHDTGSGTSSHTVDREGGPARDRSDHDRAGTALVDPPEAAAGGARSRAVHAELHEPLDRSGDFGAMSAPRVVGGNDVVADVVMRLGAL